MAAHTPGRPGGSGRLHEYLHAGLHGRLRGAHSRMFGLARHADWYDRWAGRAADRLYRRVAADVAAAALPAGALVVDVGTGPGRVPLLIAQECPALVVEGIDVSEAMIDQARRGAAPAGVPPERLRYRVADVAALPYPDASVDLVVSSLSLHHWADIGAGLRDVQRVLRPGGQAWVYDLRPVLDRAAERSAPPGVVAAVEPLRRRGAVSLRPADLLAAGARMLIRRLTIQAPS